MNLPTEAEFLSLVVETLNLPDEQKIDAETPLFGTGLGLNSIDALEIGAAIHQSYNVQLKLKDEATHRAFENVRKLHAFVTALMTAPPSADAAALTAENADARVASAG